ncbi:hypothetical protein Sango_0033900 [Sesamum angolense]|uniref:Integrase catalytic domain-containing protein n=1 Tax=Sesamum angolense TaxID=2727404 RepID=A0AAE2C5C3_9LAMI|nr:hypothetical protein Sango_0033900 [Sesamum angolense]
MYYAAANGLAEAFNKTLCNLLKKVVAKSKRDWHERIGEALWAYRTTVRTPTQATPYALVYGVEAVLPLEQQIPSLRIAIQEGLTEEENARIRLEKLEALDEKRLEAQQRLEFTKPDCLGRSIKRLQFCTIASSRGPLEDEVQSIDVEEESETSHSSTMTPPLGMGLKRKKSSPPAAYQYLKSFQKFDISKVRIVKHVFAKVRAYDEARSVSSEKLSQSLHKQQLKEVKARLQDVQAKASEEASEIQSEKKQLNHELKPKFMRSKDLAALEKYRPLDMQ